MKIVSRKLRKYHVRRQVKASRALSKSAGRRKHLRYLAALKIFKDVRPVVCPAPSNFDLNNVADRDKLFVLLKAIDDVLQNGYRVIVDFAPTKHLQPGGTLYFLANIEVLLAAFPGKIRCRYPKDEVVEQLFQHIGLLEKFGKEPRLSITAENVVNWHYATNSDATTDAFKALLIQHGEAMGGLVTRSSLYDCMSEAVTNTRKHAYPKIKSALNNWWMFSQASDEALEVVICDLGIGIPKSLLTKPEMRDFFRKLMMVGRPSSHDKDLIKIATSTNRSSTGLEYRGKGLPQMLDFIKESDHGGFRVHSGFGCYTFDATTKRDKAMTYQHPIKATIVQWTLKLQS